jgi:hypothetical protein
MSTRPNEGQRSLVSEYELHPVISYVYPQVTATHVHIYAPLTIHKDPPFHKENPIGLDNAGITSNAELISRHTELREVCSTLEVHIINIVQVSFSTAPGSLRRMLGQDHAAHIV